MRRLLGVDLGERRIGLAVADGDGSGARPFDTIRRRRKLADDVATLAELVAAQEIAELVVGLPLEASGEHGPQAELTTAWAAADRGRARVARSPCATSGSRATSPSSASDR